MMIPGAEKLFQRIATAMADGIPEEWSAAEFHAVFFEECSKYEAEYVRQADGLVRGFQPTDDGSTAVRELRSAFGEAGRALWGRVWFTLQPDGSFNVRWGYDDCDASGNAVYDEAAEDRRSEHRRRRLTNTTPPR